MRRPISLISRRSALLLGGAALGQACGSSPAKAADAGRWLAYESRLRRLSAAPAFADVAAISGPLTELTNAYRARRDLPPVRDHPGLALAARAQAADMAARGYFAHDTPEGFTPNDRVGLLARRLCGATGENLSYRRGGRAPPTAQTFLDGWIKSPGHRANLLRPEYDRVGHAAVRIGDTTYAAAVFGEEAAALHNDLPLKLAGAQALSPILATARPSLTRFEVSQPQADDAQGPWAAAHPPDLARGAWRLRPLLAQGGGRYSILWGPIFVIS